MQMPPRDESAAYALDDAILYSRILALYIDHPLTDSFKAYEEIRRKPINEAYREAVAGWARNKDVGRWASKIEEIMTPWYLMRRRMKARNGTWMFDAHTVEIPPPPTLPPRQYPKTWGEVDDDDESW